MTVTRYRAEICKIQLTIHSKVRRTNLLPLNLPSHQLNNFVLQNMKRKKKLSVFPIITSTFMSFSCCILFKVMHINIKPKQYKKKACGKSPSSQQESSLKLKPYKKQSGCLVHDMHNGRCLSVTILPCVVPICRHYVNTAKLQQLQPCYTLQQQY